VCVCVFVCVEFSVMYKRQMRQSKPDLDCSATNIRLCYTLSVCIVFTYVQIFVRNTEQLLLFFQKSNPT